MTETLLKTGLKEIPPGAATCQGALNALILAQLPAEDVALERLTSLLNPYSNWTGGYPIWSCKSPKDPTKPKALILANFLAEEIALRVHIFIAQSLPKLDCKKISSGADKKVQSK